MQILSSPPPSASKMDECLLNIAQTYGVKWIPEPRRQDLCVYIIIFDFYISHVVGFSTSSGMHAYTQVEHCIGDFGYGPRVVAYRGSSAFAQHMCTWYVIAQIFHVSWFIPKKWGLTFVWYCRTP
jgi:hypothetical protein